MQNKKFMSEELKTLLKTLVIRMVDAMDLWGDQEHNRGAKPTWAEKEHAMTEYLGSREAITALLSVIATDLNKLPEDAESVGLVTVKFIIATCNLLEAYRDIEFPEEKIPEKAGETEAPEADKEAKAEGK